MDSIRSIYKVGTGPSSSHTMGPRRAAIIFKERNKEATSFKVELYGSLALTGKGHLTDIVLKNVLGINSEIIFKPEIYYSYHPNGMKLFAYKENELISDVQYNYSKDIEAPFLMNQNIGYIEVKTGDNVEKVDPDEVNIGDIIIVKPGEKIPLDGVVIEGDSMIDTMALTGESVPRAVRSGNEVLSGCINKNGLLKI